ncbi:MAG: hypothetical protein AAF726_15860 [Planctomycetota bacterium]
MTRPLLLTGFEPFVDVDVNPSGEIARRLDGLRIGGGAVQVVGVELPVTFAGGPHAFQAAFESIAAEPLAVVSLGVHRGTPFRLERRARSTFTSEKPDNEGRLGAEVRLEGPAERVTEFDLAECAAWLRDAGADEVVQSDDAGGFLCERIYRAALDATARIGVPSLFLHVPPVDAVPAEVQAGIVERFLIELAASRLSA